MRPATRTRRRLRARGPTACPLLSIAAFHPNGTENWFKAGGTPATSSVSATYEGGTIARIQCWDTFNGATTTVLDTTSSPGALSIDAEGIHALRCRATGGDGVLSEEHQVEVKIDTQSPQADVRRTF